MCIDGHIHGFQFEFVKMGKDGWKIRFIDFPDIELPVSDEPNDALMNGVEAIEKHLKRSS